MNHTRKMALAFDEFERWKLFQATGNPRSVERLLTLALEFNLETRYVRDCYVACGDIDMMEMICANKRCASIMYELIMAVRTSTSTAELLSIRHLFACTSTGAPNFATYKSIEK